MSSPTRRNSPKKTASSKRSPSPQESTSSKRQKTRPPSPQKAASSKRPSTPQESTSTKRQKTRSDTTIQGRSASQVNLDPVALSHIPPGSLSAVSDIVDVDGDGNCGFRSLAVSLGRPEADHPQIRQELLLYMASNRQQLLNWGESDQTLDDLQASINWDGSNCLEWPQYWLTVPDSGRLVANCFDRAFVVFSSSGSYTFFPEREPSINDLANTIAIVHLGTHYMTVALNARNGAVLPPPIFETTHGDQWIQMMTISNNREVEDQEPAPPKEKEQEEEEDDAGGTGDDEDEDEDIEDDIGDDDDDADDDDDDSSDHQEFHHHSQKVENHLPRKFVQDQKTPEFNFFLGVKTADGCNEKKRPRVGIAFKSIECIYLAKFLKACGVSNPKVRLCRNGNKISKKYNAGYLGAVRWEFQDKHIGKVLKNLGFPSSHILDSDPLKIQAYFDRFKDNMPFIVFLLGFLLGDGNLYWGYIGGASGNPSTKLYNLRYFARDNFILKYIQERLTSLGCTTRAERSGNLNTLHVFQSPTLNKLLEEGFLVLKKHRLPLDSKLGLLYEFVKAYPENISIGHLPPRSLSFLEFLDKRKDDAVACVVAQDFFDCNLFGVNLFLEVLGFPKLLDIYDLDFDRFMEALEALARRTDGELSYLQIIVKQYYTCCADQRVAKGLKMIDYVYTKPSHVCVQCLPKVFFSRKLRLKQHVQRVHKKQKFQCTRCSKDFDTTHQLQLHRAEVHVKKNPDVSVCPYCNMERYSKRTATSHYNDNHHPENPFPCPFAGCLFRFKVELTLETHLRRTHNQTADTRHIKCPVGMCKRTFQEMAAMDDHVRHQHHDVPIVPCTVPECRETFGTAEYRDMHVETRHSKSFQCEHCKLTYSSEASLRNHLRDRCKVLHKNNKKGFKCTHCNKIVATKDSLTKHLRNSCRVLHKKYDKSFQCEHCNEMFTRMTSLRRHVNHYCKKLHKR